MPRSLTKKNKKVLRQTATKKVAKKTMKKTVKKTIKKTTKPTTRRSVRTAKKAGRKTTARTKANQPRVLVCANGEHCFWLNDGRIVHDLRELSAVLESMHKHLFTHHVTTERNDFADWVERVLNDADCAAKLRRSRTQRGAHGVLVRQLRLYR